MIPLKGRKIVLIGGAGFIGHNLALALLDRGAQVEIVDGLQVNNLGWHASDNVNGENRKLYLNILHQRLDLIYDSGIPLHVQDARDYSALTRIISQIKPNVIIHLAAISNAGLSNKDPYSTFDHSLRTLENALDTSRGSVEHFIYLSSSMAYGNFQQEEVDEEHPLEPIGIYGALKVAGEKIVIAYNQVFDLPYTIIRPSALYGPRCVSRRVGQIFIENALNGRSLRIDGDGSEKLDFTFIEDFVDGICLAVEKPAGRNQIYNMTFGKSRSILDLATVIQEHFSDAQLEFVDRDNLMPFRGTLSIKKAQDALGFAPKNPLEVGFRKYISWYKGIHQKTEQPKIATG